SSAPACTRSPPTTRTSATRPGTSKPRLASVASTVPEAVIPAAGPPSRPHASQTPNAATAAISREIPMRLFIRPPPGPGPAIPDREVLGPGPDGPGPARGRNGLGPGRPGPGRGSPRPRAG